MAGPSDPRVIVARRQNPPYKRITLPTSPRKNFQCDTCRGWGGIWAASSHHVQHESHILWYRMSCDACIKTWPGGAVRGWPAFKNTEDSIPQLTISKTECQICGEDKNEDEFPVLVTSTCSHEARPCLECVENWVSAQLEEGNCEIKCPAAGCDATIEAWDIQRQVPSDLYQTYLDFTLKQNLSHDRDFMYCLNPACKSGRIVDDPTDEEFECDACESKFCLAHEPMVNHDGESCEQYRNRVESRKRKWTTSEDQDEDDKSMAKVKEISTECPGCHIHIHKNGGCDHMTYYAPILEDGDHRHRRDCLHHTMNLNTDAQDVRDDGSDAESEKGLEDAFRRHPRTNIDAMRSVRPMPVFRGIRVVAEPEEESEGESEEEAEVESEEEAEGEPEGKPEEAQDKD